MGFIKEGTEELDPENLGFFVGPSVHLMKNDAEAQTWFGTVLLAVHSTLVPPEGAKLTFSSSFASPTEVASELVYSVNYHDKDWSVLRFPIRTVTGPQATQIRYSITIGDLADPTGATPIPSGTIPIQASGSPWHVATYSCNDQRQLPDVGEAVWQKLRHVHARKPFHLLMGTGDQLYNDNIWHVPAAKKWVAIRPQKKMIETNFTRPEIHEIEEFYFGSYLRWMNFHPLEQDLANIAQVNTWDDHDIFDGWGSYPEHLQNCPAFQEIFKIAKQMYMLFQLHTTADTCAEDGYFSSSKEEGMSWLTQMGPEFAVAAIDTRTGRTRDAIVPDELLSEMSVRLRKLPTTVKHLMIISAVPIAYPEVSHLESFLSTVENKNNWLVKTGVYNTLMNEFGEPELLDDIIDHWSSSRHEHEKAELLSYLRSFAEERGVRITLLSGDVHQAGYIFTSSTEGNEKLAADPGYMPQVISSAIGYKPAGNPIVKVLDQYAGTKARKISKKDAKPMFETAGWLFHDTTTRPSVSPIFANRNNFAELEIHTDGQGPFQGIPLLKVRIHIRKGLTPVDQEDTDPFELVVPPLLSGPESAYMVDTIQEQFLQPNMPEPEKPVLGCFSCCCC